MASHKGQTPTGHHMETDTRGPSRDTHRDRCPLFSQKSRNLKISQEKEKHPKAASPTPAPRLPPPRWLALEQLCMYNPESQPRHVQVTGRAERADPSRPQG